jgi:hypothetical protein
MNVGTGIPATAALLRGRLPVLGSRPLRTATVAGIPVPAFNPVHCSEQVGAGLVVEGGSAGDFHAVGAASCQVVSGSLVAHDVDISWCYGFF